MPLNLTLTEGVIPPEAEIQAIKQLTDCMLKWHGLEGNRVMTPNITAIVNVQPKGSTYSGGEAFSGVWVEWKTPSFAFAEEDIQRGYFEDVTNIIHTLSGGKQPKNHIYINVVHTVDGAWNLDGQAMTNAELGEAISRG